MATTLEFVQSVLENNTPSVYRKGDDELMVFLLLGGEGLTVSISLLEDSDLLRFRAPGFLSLKDAADREKVMRRLLSLNRELKFCSFSYNPQDDEVALEVEVPTHGTTASQEQIDRCMIALCYLAETQRPALRKLLATGTDPQEQIDAVVRDLIGEAAEDEASRE